MLYLTKSPELAKDLTQYTFLSLIETVDTFRNECSIDTWLYTIARNKYFNYLKKKRYEMISIEEIENELIANIDVEKIVENVEKKEKILKLIK